MLKKAKLYSLLAITLASTAVGLFGYSQTASAQTTPAPDTATWASNGTSPDKSRINYQGIQYNARKGSEVCFSNKVDSVQSSGDFYFPQDSTVYVATNPKQATIDGNKYTIRYVIYFPSGVNPDQAKQATWVYFVNGGPCDGGTVGGTMVPGKQKTDVEKTIPFDPSQGTNAGLDQNNTKPNDTAVSDPPKAPTPSNCNIDGVGWLVCPVLRFLAKVTDQSYHLIESSLLRVPPLALPGQSGDQSLYNAWSKMRDFANVFFIIAFLIIVFSQLTSIGIGNYGIKRLLPKIIVAAVLVNVSYYICAIGVDISNILGSSLKDMLVSIKFEPIPDDKGGAVQNVINGRNIGFGAVVDTILAGAAIYVLLPVLLPLLIGAVLAVMTVVITLTLRQALIILLVTVSPLAFVALLLPNTEDYFKRWRQLFTAMLLIYPIISFIFGACSLASGIILASSKDVSVQLVGAGVAIIPLFITPLVMKVSGGLLNRFAGIVNNPSKGWLDGKRQALEDRGKLIKAGRTKRTSDWVNDPSSSSGIFGGAGSRRRRAFTALTSYGANNRERARKDNLQQAESEVEGTYLESAKGLAANNAAKNAQISLQNTQISADTVRISSPEGMDLQEATMGAEKRKKIAEDDASATATNAINTWSPTLLVQEKEAELNKEMAENNAKGTGIEHANEDLKIQAETSSERLSTLGNRDKQAYEELAAAGSSDPTLLATHGVSAATAAAAQDSSFQAKAVNSATSTARSEGETSFANEINTNPTLLAQAGGNVNRDRGESRARAGATATINRDANEAVENEMQTMTGDHPTSYTDASGVHHDGLEVIMRSTSPDIPVERKAAAAIMRIKGGSDDEVRDTWQHLGTAPMTPELATIQKLVMDKAGDRVPAIVSQSKRADAKRGEFRITNSAGAPGTMDDLVENRITTNSMSPEIMASMPEDDLKHMYNVLATNPVLRTSPQFRNLQNDILQFRTNPTLEGKRPPRKITDQMDAIMYIP